MHNPRRRRALQRGGLRGVESWYKRVLLYPRCGGQRCDEPTCENLSKGAIGMCAAHGGARRCSEEGCDKMSKGPSGKCIAHGGGRRCDEPGCGKTSAGGNGKCCGHGGGWRCSEEGCGKLGLGAVGKCKAHGGGREVATNQAFGTQAASASPVLTTGIVMCPMYIEIKSGTTRCLMLRTAML